MSAQQEIALGFFITIKVKESMALKEQFSFGINQAKFVKSKLEYFSEPPLLRAGFP